MAQASKETKPKWQGWGHEVTHGLRLLPLAEVYSPVSIHPCSGVSQTGWEA